MTAEQLRYVHRAQPYRPFKIRIADGRSFAIKHPDYLSQSPGGRTVIVYQDDESFHILNVLLVTELEVEGSSNRGDAAA